MAEAATLSLEGIDDLNDMLTQLAPNEARNLLRTTVQGIAAVARDRISEAAPFKHLRSGFRAVRRRGDGPGKPVSEVRAKPSAADWRWFEFGTEERVQKTTGRRTGRIIAQPFVVPQVEILRGEMPQIYREQFGAKLEAQLARKAKKAAR